MPDGPLCDRLRQALLGVASEIWSAPAAPVQHTAAVAFTEPAQITRRIARSRSLHATISRAVAGLWAAAGLLVPPPQAAFYVYPDFEPWREHLRARHGVTTGAALARLLLERYGAGTLPASAFGEHPAALRLRLATGLLYGDTQHQRAAALTAPDPLTLPWIAATLAPLHQILTDLAETRSPRDPFLPIDVVGPNGQPARQPLPLPGPAAARGLRRHPPLNTGPLTSRWPGRTGTRRRSSRAGGT